MSINLLNSCLGNLVKDAQINEPVLEKRSKKSNEGALTFQPGVHSTKTLKLLRKVTLKAKHDLDKKPMDRLGVKYGRTNKNFQKSLQKLKSQLRENPKEAQELKPTTKKLIKEVIKIESSVKYRLSRHLMNRLDIFSRFWFPILYIPWLNITLFVLDKDVVRFVILNFLILLVVVSYCAMKIRQTSKQLKMTKWQACKYYMKGK